MFKESNSNVMEQKKIAINFLPTAPDGYQKENLELIMTGVVYQCPLCPFI